jgi:hypothetical protein
LTGRWQVQRVLAVMTAPTKRRIPDGLLMVLALPIYQVWNIARYANTCATLPAKIGTFAVFVPLIAVLTVIWGFFWFAIAWAVWQLVAR